MFVSYAQNFEDVMLWRALKHVGTGCYIDVGANDPTSDSVTKAFYERGWRGLNIEPVDVHVAALQKERPGDVNLACALGAVAGELELFVCDVHGYVTSTADLAMVHSPALQGEAVVSRQVPVRTLADVCREYVTGEVHFLKIDVEGFEAQVLKGADFSRVRPWIVVVEATVPGSPEAACKEWEHHLVTASYQFAYTDGLNRFYVAVEHADLLPAFACPPNVFDEFVRNRECLLEARAQWLENEWSAARICVESLKSRAGIDERELALVRQELQAQSNELQVRTREVQEQVQALKEATTAWELERARSQWLENEWNAAKAKIDELNHSSHHWWTVASGLDNELQRMHASRSIRVTRPLRVLAAGVKKVMGRAGGAACVAPEARPAEPVVAAVPQVSSQSLRTRQLCADMKVARERLRRNP